MPTRLRYERIREGIWREIDKIGEKNGLSVELAIDRMLRSVMAQRQSARACSPDVQAKRKTARKRRLQYEARGKLLVQQILEKRRAPIRSDPPKVRPRAQKKSSSTGRTYHDRRTSDAGQTDRAAGPA